VRSQVSDCTTLTYWDGHGACERIRLMLAICGEPWEDRVALDDSGATHMTTYAQLQKLSEAGVLMADQLPLLQIDGLNLVQGWAAVRYLARKHGLYGKDNAEATKCDILQETMQDYNGKADQDDKYLCRLGRALGDGPFFLGANMSFVDVTFFRLIDNREAEAAGTVASMPAWVQAHHAKMHADAKLAAYLKSDQRFPRPGKDGYYDRVKACLPYLTFAGGDGTTPPMACDTWNFKA
jgi:glutathione S-transferase